MKSLAIFQLRLSRRISTFQAWRSLGFQHQWQLLVRCGISACTSGGTRFASKKSWNGSSMAWKLSTTDVFGETEDGRRHTVRSAPVSQRHSYTRALLRGWKYISPLWGF